jgi:hypothetical protein
LAAAKTGEYRSRSTLPTNQRFGSQKQSPKENTATNFLENLSFTGNFENWFDPAAEKPPQFVANVPGIQNQMNKTDINFGS